RRAGKGTMGYSAAPKAITADDVMRELAPEDLVRFGMIPEFIGRLPVVSVLDQLTESDLERILVNTKNAMVKQYSKLFAMDGANLTLTKDGVRAIAEKALSLKTGARALRAIMENIMLEVMYDLPHRDDISEVVIDRAVVEGRKKPRLKKGVRSEKKNAA
ncbi:MAG: ATP-dependent Clp protease ATP-binding subunit ClpX, partial [Opitutaceae bacterium]